MRYVASAIFLSIVFIAVTAITLEHDSRLDPVMYDYVSAHFQEDTGARNAVAAILMNYRMYDTIYEALILLTAIIGMKAFLPNSRDLHEGEEPQSNSSHSYDSREGNDV